MGIVNVTPDSFSDGGQHLQTAAAIAHCEALVAQGADVLDIGGESTRPGAQSPSELEEQRRVLPVLTEALKLGLPVSLDSSQPELMAKALELGVDILNDVRSFRRPGALNVLSRHPLAGACVMHMRGEFGPWPGDHFDMLGEVKSFLSNRTSALRAVGVASDRIVVDPGFGFDKSFADNMAVQHGLRQLVALGYPVLAGWSRKGTLGRLTGRAVAERQSASVAAALACAHLGARLLRVHDVAATVDALKIWKAFVPHDAANQELGDNA